MIRIIDKKFPDLSYTFCIDIVNLSTLPNGLCLLVWGGALYHALYVNPSESYEAEIIICYAYSQNLGLLENAACQHLVKNAYKSLFSAYF